MSDATMKKTTTMAKRNERARTDAAAAVAMGAALLVVGGAGCLQILGDDATFVLGTGGAGGAGGAGGESGGAGGAGGTGNTGGAGGTTSSTGVCEPGQMQSCYTGPDGTEGVGECKAGTETCQEDGAGWGACQDPTTPKPETCEFETDEDCDSYDCARWSLASGGEGVLLPLGMQTDSAGNLVVFGAAIGTPMLGPDTLDATANGPLFLAKFSPIGEVLWTKSFGGAALNDNFNATNDGLAIDANDNILITGTFEGTANCGGGALTADGEDFFVAKFTPGGIHAWSKRFGGAMDQEVWQIVSATGGDVLVTGTFANGFVIGGNFTSGSGAFVARLASSDGDVVSVLSVDPLGSQYVDPVLAAGPENTWALAGRCADGAFIEGETLTSCANFVVKFGSDDVPQWATNIPTGNTRQIRLDSQGGLVFLHDFLGTIDIGTGPLDSAGSWDLLVGRLAAEDGAPVWARVFGGPGDNEYGQLALDDQNRIFVTITTTDSIDFGGGLLPGAGLGDLFVLALDAEGLHRWSRVFGDATSQLGDRVAVRPDGSGLFVSVLTEGEIDFGTGVQSSSSLLSLAELGP